MKFTAYVNIMPREEILDPQGKATLHGMETLGMEAFSSVRIGKRVRLNLDAADQAEAEQMVDEACKKLLANLIMEYYEFTVVEAVSAN